MNIFNRGGIIVALSCLSASAALYFGFAGLDKASMEALYNDYTWYFLVFATGLWMQVFLSSLPDAGTVKAFARRHCLPAVAAIVVTLLAVMASPPDFRILADETNLLGMSMAMYDHHACYNPTQVLNYYHGMQRIVSRVTDMRPAFFPFVVSLLHAVTGYNENNVFAANAIAGCLSLFLLYYLVQIWFGRFWGTVALLLLGSYPLFVLYMTSAGFEVFNLLVALLLFSLAEKFLRRPVAENAENLLLLLPLLAQTRYESVLAVFCAVPLVLYRLPRPEYDRLTPRLVVWPLLFLPSAWLRVVTFNQQAFQVSDLQQAFGFDLLFKNLQKALPFFAGSQKAFGMVPVITFLAVAGAVWIIMDLLASSKEAKASDSMPVSWQFSREAVMGLFVCAFFLLHAIARFAYFWGDLTLQYTSRLGVIFLPALVFLAVSLLRRLTASFALDRNWALVGAVLVMLHGWPVAGQNLAVRDILFYREFKSVREYLQAHHPARKDYIVVSELSNAYTPLRYSSVTVAHLNENHVRIMQDLKNRTWQYLLIIQKVDTATGLPLADSRVEGSMNLETLYESQLSAERIVRISRFKP